MKTINKGNAVKVVAFLILSAPGLARAASTLSRDAQSDSTIVASSMVAAKSNQEPLAAIVSPQTKDPSCATPHVEAPMASDSYDPVLDDARRGVDPFAIGGDD